MTNKMTVEEMARDWMVASPYSGNHDAFIAGYDAAFKLLMPVIEKSMITLEDFHLSELHSGDCSIKFQYGGGCNCMDKSYFSDRLLKERAISAGGKRAREYLSKYKNKND